MQMRLLRDVKRFVTGALQHNATTRQVWLMIGKPVHIFGLK